MSVYRLAALDQAERDSLTPRIHPSAFIAPGAVLVGNVEVAEKASVWFGAVVRGDVEKIVIGAGSNIQDGAVLHADPGDPCIVGANVTVGHRAVVHGATLENGALIGIGAVVLNKARIGQNAVIGAGALVPPGTEIPAGMLALGVPARVVRTVAAPENAGRYQAMAERYRRELQQLGRTPRYQLTLRGQDALDPFSDLNHQMKRGKPSLLASLRLLLEGAPEKLDPENLHLLEREGLVRPSSEH